MTEPVLRRVRPGDETPLAAIWHRVFGDPETLALAFLKDLPALGGGVCAEEAGKLLGAAYAVTDFTLGDRRAAYIYAVAVLPEERGRGLGMALTRAAAELGRELGAEILCTLPANAGLYPWYERVIGLRCALRRRKEEIESCPGPVPTSLSPEEYAARREALLRGRPHVRLGTAALRQERFNCRLCGGELMEIGGGIAAVYCDEGETQIRELLAPAGADRAALAAALGAAYGTERALLLTPNPAGAPCLAADRPLPEGCMWGLTLD